MKRIFPAIGASLMLAANVLTGETGVKLISHEVIGPDQNIPGDMNTIEETTQGETENVGDSHIKYLDQYDTESGGRMIIYDNDYFVPKFEKNLMPMKN